MADLLKWLNNTNFNESPERMSDVCTTSLKPVLYVGILSVGKSSSTNVNRSGLKLKETISTVTEFRVVVKVIQNAPENEQEVKAILCDWADNLGLNLILTTGGTGFGSSNITPDATRAIIQKEALAMQCAITIASLKVTPYAMISRAVCGIRNNVLIVNFPRSAKASSDCLSVILPVLPKALRQLTGKELVEENSHRFPPLNGSMPRYLNHSNDSTSFQSLHDHQQSNDINARTAYLPPSCFNSSSEVAANTASHNSNFNDVTLASHALAQINCMEDNQLSAHEIQSNSGDVIIPMNEASIVGSRPPSRIDDLPNHSISDSLENINKVARRPRSLPYSKIPLDKALSLVLDISTALPVVNKHYKIALGFVVAEDVKAKDSVPQFPLSAIEGYAVRALDNPSNLNVLRKRDTFVRKNFAGVTFLNPGETIKVKPRSPLPKAADAVVPVENTLMLRQNANVDDDERELEIRVLKQVVTGENVLPAGCEIHKEEIVLKKGTKLNADNIGILASVGVTDVLVHRKPVIAVFSSGKKVNVSTSFNVAEFPDPNRITLMLFLRQHGYDVLDMGIADDPATLKETFLLACEQADVIVSNGGTSIGENDYIKPILRHIGANIHFGQVNIQPGKHTTFATLNSPYGKKHVFALPGKSMSILVAFNLFVLPFLKKISGCNNPHPQQSVVKAKIPSDICLQQHSAFQSVGLVWKPNESVPWVNKVQTKNQVTNLDGTNAMLMLPAASKSQTTLKRGHLVEVMVIDHL